MMLVPQAPGGLTPNATPLHIAAAKGYIHVASAILHAWVSFRPTLPQIRVLCTSSFAINFFRQLNSMATSAQLAFGCLANLRCSPGLGHSSAALESLGGTCAE